MLPELRCCFSIVAHEYIRAWRSPELHQWLFESEVSCTSQDNAPNRFDGLKNSLGLSDSHQLYPGYKRAYLGESSPYLHPHREYNVPPIIGGGFNDPYPQGPPLTASSHCLPSTPLTAPPLTASICLHHQLLSPASTTCLQYIERGRPISRGRQSRQAVQIGSRERQAVEAGRPGRG